VKDTESLSSLGIEKHMAVPMATDRHGAAALALPWRCPGAAPREIQ